MDTKIKEEDKEYLQMIKEWDVQQELWEKRCQVEVAEKERKEEVERRLAAQRREDREQKLERARRAKVALEDNLDALRKEKWPRCTQ